MTSIPPSDRPLLRISKVAGRYLIFDIDDVMYLRRNQNICSVFVGTLPQNPEQNMLMGLPLELMPEEAQVLVEKKVAYVADDGVFHPNQLMALDVSSRRAYLQSLKNQGKRMQMAAIESSNRNKPKIQKVQSKKNKNKGKDPRDSQDSPAKDVVGEDVEADENTDLFDSTPASRKPANKLPDEVEGYALTPTTSSFLLQPSAESEPEPSVAVDVPYSYPLFAHLHNKGYFMMPGLRFGCDYNIYPGDPLRFHSHFAGVHFGWEDEITMMDLVGGGRLATSVKKGYLFGGAVADGSVSQEARNDDAASHDNRDAQAETQGGPVRVFCLEWAGM